MQVVRVPPAGDIAGQRATGVEGGRGIFHVATHVGLPVISVRVVGITHLWFCVVTHRLIVSVARVCVVAHRLIVTIGIARFCVITHGFVVSVITERILVGVI